MNIRILKKLVFDLVVIAGLAVSLLPGPVSAQDFPNRAIKIIVPYGAGGGSDILSRNLADRLSKRLGQSVIVENRPGADGIIGTSLVASAKPDGYTYLVAVDSHILNPLLFKSLPYDTFKDMTGVTLIARSPYVFVTTSDFPAKNMKEFVAGTRAEPNKRSIANSEKYSLLLNQMLAANERLELVHVPYKGSGPMMIDVAAGTVSMSPTSIMAATPYLQSGRMKAIGVTGDARTPALPNVPTLKEQGFNEFDFYVNYGLYAPAGTPRAALDTMQRAIKEIVNTPEMKAILLDKGAVPVANTVDEFNALQKANFLALKKLAEKFNLKPE
jgi:tripartite-type tricarboxylate transporter receptor subunit TctC